MTHTDKILYKAMIAGSILILLIPGVIAAYIDIDWYWKAAIMAIAFGQYCRLTETGGPISVWRFRKETAFENGIRDAIDTFEDEDFAKAFMASK